MFKKGLIGLTILIFLAISFNIYIHEENIDDLAYIIAIGIDEGKDNNLNITFQLALPTTSKSSDNSSSSEQSNSSGKSQKKDTISKTVECKTINSGLNMVNNLISKRIDLSHCKFIIFSEEIAKKDISDFIYTLENNLELRANCSILVTSGETKLFLENAIPTFENSTVSYYEAIRNSSKYTGYTHNITLNDFYTSIDDSFGEPCAMLCKFANNNEENGDNNSEQNINLNFNGLAVFKNNKFIGELSPEDTLCYLIITNNLKKTVITIPSPFDDNKVIDIHISQFKNTKNNVTINNSIPAISTSIFIDSTILSDCSDFDSNSSDEIKKLENAISDYLKSSISNFYEKISKNYQSDICGFGKYAVHYFLTEGDWNSYNWNNKFSKANFDIKANINVNISYFIS